MSITIIIIVLTVIISVMAFSNSNLMDDLIFYPPAVTHRNQWYRFITCGFIHGDIGHLGFNMYSFYLFGEQVEDAFQQIFGQQAGKLVYILLYLTSLAACLVPTYTKHKDDYNYRSLGASGAVSAVVFIFMFLFPTQKLGLIFLPIYIPGFLFGIIYLVVSYVMDKRGAGNINHSAHIWGAIYGLAFVIVTSYALTDFKPVARFISQVTNYF
jgi:membrane associated rhomboid family serine protease